jgi:hypothetical protein
VTFGAMAAWQAWLLLAAAGGFAAWLFLLKLRPPRVIVPSLLLWRRVLDEARDLTLWERIRRAVSLVVTIAIALALAFAVTRPSPAGRAAAASPGRLLIVIDSSWSMMARTLSGETRWDRARAQARRLVAASGLDVTLATTADGLVEGPTTDRALLETMLERLTPAGGEATSWPRVAGADAVHFITDGAIARPLDTGVVVHSVFEPAANVAITAFDVRPSLASGNAGDAYLEVANFAPSAQQVRLTLARGAAPVFERGFDMAAGETLRQVIPLVRGPGASLRAHVSARENALGADDEAFTWIVGARPMSVVVVGQQTEWLRTLLGGNPDVSATFIDPSEYRSEQDGRPPQDDAVSGTARPAGSPGARSEEADRTDGPVFIFDRWAPQDPPRRPALCFAPPAGTPWLATRRGNAPGSAGPSTDERQPQWEVAGSHPVVRGVDPLTLSIDRARAYSSDTLVPVARSARGTPLVYVSEPSGSRPLVPRLVVVTFGAGESNLASAPAFPVLVGDALEWLAHTTAAGTRRPGLMSFEDSIEKVTGPRGAAVPLARVNGAALAMLRAPGLYVAEGGGARSTIAVNVGDPQVSNLLRTSASAARARPVTSGTSGGPWWLYAAIAAFALALVEWWTWQRRITV